MAAPATIRKPTPAVTNPASGPDGLVRDAQGNLVSANQSQVQSLAASMGAPATPTTPAGAAALGATPDSAKMAGTPAALPAQTGASAPAAQPGGAPPAPRTLRSVVEQEQYGAPSAGDPAQQDRETRRAADAARLQARFGDLGSRVQNLIDSFDPALLGTGTPVPGTHASAPVEVTPGGPSVGDSSSYATTAAPAPGAVTVTPAGARLSAATQALLTGLAGTPTPEAVRAAAEAVAAETGTPATQVDLSQFVGGAALGSFVGAHTATDVRLTDQTAAALGYGSTHELAAALGVPEEQVRGLSLKQLDALVQGQFSKQYQDVDQAKAALADPALGPNERAAARAALRAAGADGALASHDDLARVQNQIRGSDVVEFAGERVPVGQLLSDGRVTALASQWADSPPDSEFRKNLAREEPGLSRWLAQNEAVVQDAVTSLHGGLTHFSDVQTANSKALKDFSATTGLDDSQTTAILKAMNPSYDPSRLVTQATAVPTDLTALVGTIQKAGLDPARTMQALAGVAAQDPAAFAALRKNLSAAPAAVSRVLADSTPEQATAKLMLLGREMALPADASLADVTKYIFGDSPEAAATLVRTAHREQLAGIHDPTKDAALAILDSNHDGVIDGPGTVRHNFENQFLAGKAAPGTQTLASGSADASTSPLGALAPRVLAGKTVRPADVQAIPDSTSSADLQSIKDALLQIPNAAGVLAAGTGDALDRRITTADTRERLAPIGDMQDPDLAIYAIDRLRASGKPYDPAEVDRFLAAHPALAARQAELAAYKAHQAEIPDAGSGRDPLAQTLAQGANPMKSFDNTRRLLTGKW